MFALPRRTHGARLTPGLRRAALSLAVAAVALPVSLPGWALYKVVGPDGRITYTDRPPVEGKAVAIKANGSSVSTESLPYELAQVVTRFPVTLYSAKNCGPCEGARSMLSRRGVPFKELSVDSKEDVQAFQRLEGAAQLPVLRIGGQRLNGYSETEWTSYLDTAGYPKQSMLPSNYRQAPATPLAGPSSEPAPAEGASKAKRASEPAPATAPPAGNAPPGFKF